MAVDPRTERLVRRTTMVAAVAATYFLLAADYGTQDSAFGPVKRITESVKLSAKRFIFNSDKEDQLNDEENVKHKNVK
ncbi:hypothetical protein M5K25_010265 [Dendrobium thyrsiflorum]|uniref:Uncharacterized protein n=1 Tax=Dendrobium thyrsiflorum TaxID=117978 RepID=A0ABD0V6S7_DENTH